MLFLKPSLNARIQNSSVENPSIDWRRRFFVLFSLDAKILRSTSIKASSKCVGGYSFGLWLLLNAKSWKCLYPKTWADCAPMISCSPKRTTCRWIVQRDSTTDWPGLRQNQSDFWPACFRIANDKNELAFPWLDQLSMTWLDQDNQTGDRDKEMYLDNTTG